MLEIIKWVIGLAFLILLSIIDIKTYDKEKGYIPSILTTLFLLVTFLVNYPYCIYSGIFSGLIAWLLTDLEYWGGIADFKVFIASAMLFSNVLYVCIFAGLVTIIGLLYKIILKLKYDKTKLIPFIPVFFISFFITFLINIL